MSLGSFIARNCSTCGTYTLERNVFSEPTARSSLWTDGKRNGSNLPGLAWLLLFKCRQSSDLRDEVCEIDPWWPKYLLPEWIKVVKKINKPTLTDYIHFLMVDAREKGTDEYRHFLARIAENEPKREGSENATDEDDREKTDKGKDEKSLADPTFMDYIEFLSTGVFDSEKERYIRLHAWWAGNDLRREGGQASPMTKAEKTNLRVFLPLLDESSGCDRLMKAEGFRELGSFAAAEKLLATHFDISLRKAVNVIRDLSRRGVKSVEEIPTAR
jgi:hypothetical protein